jgi:hypothetical protein
LNVVFAVLAVLPDFFTVKVKVQVPLALTLTEVAVATQAFLVLLLLPQISHWLNLQL